MRHDRLGKLRRDAEAAFDVNVRIDQPGGDERAGHVDHLTPGVVIAYPGDQAIDDGKRRRLDFAGKDIDHAPAAQHQVSRFVAARHGQQFALVHAVPPSPVRVNLVAG